MGGSLSKFEVVEATGTDMEPELYRFRYAVFVSEQGKYLSTADHVRGELRDDLDPVARHFGLLQNGRIIGSLRHVHGLQHTNESTRLHLGLGQFAHFQDEAFSFSGRLMLLPEHRGSGGLLRLVRHNFASLRAAGALLDFIHCRPQLVGLYEQMGYRRYRPEFWHSELGRQIPMVLLGDDIDHMVRVHSPFLTTARHFPASQDTRQWLDALIAESARDTASKGQSAPQ